MDRVFFIVGTVLAALGVAAGAFGAHALRGRLAPDLLTAFETGVRYHLIHALALLSVAWAATRWPGQAVNAAGWLFLVGTLLLAATFDWALIVLSSLVGAAIIVQALDRSAVVSSLLLLALTALGTAVQAGLFVRRNREARRRLTGSS